MKSSLFRSPYFVAAAFLLAFIIFFSGLLGIIVLVGENKDQEKPKFETFENCNDLASYMNEHYQSPIYYYDDIDGRGSVGEEAPSESDGGSDDYSQTNVQVEGVDEADVVKTNGESIFLFDTNNNLVIVDAETMEVKSRTLLKFSPNGMFLDGNRVLVYGPSSYTWRNKLGGGYESSRVVVYNITNTSEPKLVRSISMQGYTGNARMVDGYVYLTTSLYTNNTGDLTGEEVNDLLPSYVIDDESKKLIEESKPECTDVSHFGENANNFVTVASINVAEGDFKTKVILGNSETIYASTDNIYLTSTNYNLTPISEPDFGITVPEPDRSFQPYETSIFRLGLNSGDIEFEASGEVIGTILNQFSMDEYYGTFRIATTHTDENFETVNNLFILDEELNELGSVTDLAKGENIYSVRFMGDRAFVVTFETIDPLFAIDLSDPENPEVKGELKISGYSSYLHPLDADHLIGIGKEVDEYTGSEKGLKFTIFDVSDLDDPRVLDNETIDSDYSYSEVLSDHKAFLYHPEQNLIVVPVYYTTQSGYYELDRYIDSKGFDGFEAIKISDDFENFELRDISDTKKGYQSYWSSPRSLYIGENLFTYKDGMLKKLNIDTFEQIDEVEISKDYYKVVY
jgi:inhibitor of cysteine peptidase